MTPPPGGAPGSATTGAGGGAPSRNAQQPPAAAGALVAPPGVLLGAAELRGILRIVEGCGRASTLPVFREAALEGLARHLGYRHAAFFLGSSLSQAFQDRHPVGQGLGLRMAQAFQERYPTLDAFVDPDSLKPLLERGPLTLDEFGPPDRPEIRLHFQHLLKTQGVRAKLLVRLATPAGIGGFVSLSDPRPHAFGPRDRAVCALVGRHLGNLLRFHIRSAPSPSLTAKLSARECDVVRLVADGCSNRQISATLCLSVDTVKHHVGRAMEAAGCTNRTQLALAWHREVGALPIARIPG